MVQVLQQPEVRNLWNAAVFDYAQFEHICMENHSLMAELIVMFRSQVERSTAELSEAMTTASWKFHCHTLKGAAAAIGAVEIQMISAILEEKPCPKRHTERENTKELLVTAGKKFFAEADKTMRQMAPQTS